jgi:hypothetical protein
MRWAKPEKRKSRAAEREQPLPPGFQGRPPSRQREPRRRAPESATAAPGANGRTTWRASRPERFPAGRGPARRYKRERLSRSRQAPRPGFHAAPRSARVLPASMARARDRRAGGTRTSSSARAENKRHDDPEEQVARRSPRVFSEPPRGRAAERPGQKADREHAEK